MITRQDEPSRLLHICNYNQLLTDLLVTVIQIRHHNVIIQSRHHYMCNMHGPWMCQKQCHTKETVIISFSQWSCHLSVLVNKHEDDSWDKRVVTLSVDIWVVESRTLPIGWVWPPLHICSTDRRRKGHKTPSVSLQWNWIETKILKLGLMIRALSHRFQLSEWLCC